MVGRRGPGLGAPGPHARRDEALRRRRSARGHGAPGPGRPLRGRHRCRPASSEPAETRGHRGAAAPPEIQTRFPPPPGRKWSGSGFCPPRASAAPVVRPRRALRRPCPHPARLAVRAPAHDPGASSPGCLPAPAPCTCCPRLGDPVPSPAEARVPPGALPPTRGRSPTPPARLPLPPRPPGGPSGGRPPRQPPAPAHGPCPSRGRGAGCQLRADLIAPQRTGAHGAPRALARSPPSPRTPPLPASTPGPGLFTRPQGWGSGSACKPAPPLPAPSKAAAPPRPPHPRSHTGGGGTEFARLAVLGARGPLPATRQRRPEDARADPIPAGAPRGPAPPPQGPQPRAPLAHSLPGLSLGNLAPRPGSWAGLGPRVPLPAPPSPPPQCPVVGGGQEAAASPGQTQAAPDRLRLSASARTARARPCSIAAQCRDRGRAGPPDPRASPGKPLPCLPRPGLRPAQAATTVTPRALHGQPEGPLPAAEPRLSAGPLQAAGGNGKEPSPGPQPDGEPDPTHLTPGQASIQLPPPLWGLATCPSRSPSPLAVTRTDRGSLTVPGSPPDTEQLHTSGSCAMSCVLVLKLLEGDGS
ncbi:basic proline-rich protein-like [Canis lupus familiaris]|uniref:basic proline-rich protein-like n=1 Tax=Canis lupus familiaris TaxID=9615 RepID=UPI0018F7B98F|nr:basic proline-rich protein-like [Canis lupus familiaris]